MSPKILLLKLTPAKETVLYPSKKNIKGIHMSRNLIKQHPQHQSGKNILVKFTFVFPFQPLGLKGQADISYHMGPVKLSRLRLNPPFSKYGSLNKCIQKQEAIHSNKKTHTVFKTASLPKGNQQLQEEKPLWCPRVTSDCWKDQRSKCLGG